MSSSSAVLLVAAFLAASVLPPVIAGASTLIGGDGQIVRRNREYSAGDLLRMSAERMRVRHPTNDKPYKNGQSSFLNLWTNSKSKTKESMRRWEAVEDYRDSHEARKQLWLEEKEEGNHFSTHISKEKWKTQIEKLLALTPERQTNSEGGMKAAMYIKKRMLDAGLKVDQHSYSFAEEVASVLQMESSVHHGGAVLGGPVDTTKSAFVQAMDALRVQDDKVSPNVFGKLQGSDKNSDCYYVLGAHYDSIGDYDQAPGADDNGSGTTSLLTAIDAFTLAAKNSRAPACSVYFVAFSGEEAGLLGSHAFVQKHVKGGKLGTFEGAIIMDQVGYKSKGHKTEVIFETVGRNHKASKGINAIVDTLAKSADAIGGFDKYYVNYKGFGSDHMSFLGAGKPAVLLIEREDEDYADAFGHSSRDTGDHLDHEFGSKLGRLAATAIARLASNSESSAKDTDVHK